MGSGKVGVAISTTGSRPELMTRAFAAWDEAGVDSLTENIDTDRRGVAWNKNVGLEMLMDAECEHLFLADDDMHPLTRFSITRYVDDPALHLSLSWGAHRSLGTDGEGHSLWSHPRGVMLYFHSSVIEKVGGYRTEYGKGGDEHVDLSRRIHQAGLTPHLYMDLEQNPREWFHAEDMPKPGETVNQFRARKRRHSTIRRTYADEKRIAEVWKKYDGVTDFVPYRN